MGWQRPLGQGQQAHQGGRGGWQPLEAAEEDLAHQVLFGPQGRGLARHQGPPVPLPGQGSGLVGQLQEIPEQAGIAEALGDQVVAEGLGQVVLPEEVLQHQAQVLVLQAVHAHQRRGRFAPAAG
ncbi:MAG: hypothetical protein IPN91_16160 [Holophagaceae bacterium]|uniref:Uncharacterized protein n=1 Tax=Candidatus Geothrix odensensis TaxID=2954440 RepID=A0A936F5A8_9BACT|nr:hypothetical protein [Candidatus Geothrix odensensis]